MSVFCGGFLFFGISCFILKARERSGRPTSLGMLLTQTGFLFFQFDAILLLASIGTNLAHNPGLNLPLKIEPMLDHSISQKQKKKIRTGC